MKSESKYISNIKISNLLSFKAETELSLGRLNVLIGPNGGGKSNFLDILELLSYTNRELRTPLKNSGSIWREWIYGGMDSNQEISIKIVFNDESSLFQEYSNREVIIERQIVGMTKNNLFLKNNEYDEKFPFESKNKNDISDRIKTFLKEMGFYINVQFGREVNNKIRQNETQSSEPRKLEQDLSNLGIILNKLQNDNETGKEVEEYIKLADPRIVKFGLLVENAILPYLDYQDSKSHIFKNKVSDGTLRFLSLIAILRNAEQYSLICIDEPDLGLNQRLVEYLAELLIYASQNCQVVITTHSFLLLDAIGATNPDSIITVSNNRGYSEFEKIDNELLTKLLKRHNKSMGELMSLGHIG